MQLQHRAHDPAGYVYSARLSTGVSVTVIVEPPPDGGAWRAQQIELERLAMELLRKAGQA